MDKYKLVAIDLDGTLLNSSKEISLKDKLSLRKLSKKIKLVICTGRSIDGVYYSIEKLNLKNKCTYVITSNGSEIYEFPAMKLKHTTCIDKKIAISIVNSLLHSGEFLLAIQLRSDTNNNIVRVTDSNLLNNYFVDDLNKISITRILAQYNNDVKIRNADLNQLLMDFKEEIKVVYNDSNNFEVLNKCAGKWDAIQRILEYENIMKEQVICIGDSDNDIDMIENAGMGIAMGNSINCLKEKAKFVTKSNDDSGVSFALDSVLRT